MSMSVQELDQRIARFEELQARNMHHSMDLLHVQGKVQRDAEFVTTRSNMEKAMHDAVMNIANNMK